MDNSVNLVSTQTYIVDQTDRYNYFALRRKCYVTPNHSMWGLYQIPKLFPYCEFKKVLYLNDLNLCRSLLSESALAA